MNTEMSTRTYSRPHTNQPKDLIDIVKIDEYKQPRSRNEPYTELTDIQMQNLKKVSTVFFKKITLIIWNFYILSLFLPY